MRLGGLSRSRVHPSTYELTAPMSPHAAAAIDGVTIALDDFERPQTNRPLVVEGAGGVLVPLNDRDLMVDLVKHLDIPVIVVARSGLGTINHTLLTLEALRTRRPHRGRGDGRGTSRKQPRRPGTFRPRRRHRGNSKSRAGNPGSRRELSKTPTLRPRSSRTRL